MSDQRQRGVAQRWLSELSLASRSDYQQLGARLAEFKQRVRDLSRRIERSAAPGPQIPTTVFPSDDDGA